MCVLVFVWARERQISFRSVFQSSHSSQLSLSLALALAGFALFSLYKNAQDMLSHCARYIILVVVLDVLLVSVRIELSVFCSMNDAQVHETWITIMPAKPVPYFRLAGYYYSALRLYRQVRCVVYWPMFMQSNSIWIHLLFCITLGHWAHDATQKRSDTDTARRVTYHEIVAIKITWNKIHNLHPIHK